MEMDKHSRRVHCEVDVKEGVQYGVYANAFRVLDEGDGDAVLDFCLYSATESKAVVVSRVRVKRDFLGSVRDRLSESLGEITETPATGTVLFLHDRQMS